MTELFADGIRSIAVTNGVLRIELMQLRHNRERNALEPQNAGTLMMPVPLLKDFTVQLVKTMEKLKEHEEKEKAGKTMTAASDTPASVTDDTRAGNGTSQKH